MGRYKHTQAGWHSDGWGYSSEELGQTTGNWWQDEENYYKSHTYSSRKTQAKSHKHNAGYYNMEQAREVVEEYSQRTKNLINSITGKQYKLKLAEQYGIDKKNIYLNYNDSWLTFMTQDAFLGKISQLLAKGLFYGAGNELRIKKELGEKFMPLYHAVEQARNHREMQDNFGGAGYYLNKHWQEVATDEVAEIENDLLQGIFGYSNDDAELTKKLPSKLLPLLDKYIQADSKQDAYQAFKELLPFFKPPQDEQEQQKLSNQTQKATNNALTTQGKRNASSTDGKGRKSRNQSGTQNGKGWQGGGVAQNHETKKDNGFYTKTVNKHRQIIGVLTKQLQSILSDNQTRHYVRPFKRGKIDKKRIYKVATKNNRIFKQLAEPNAKNYGFALVLDQSGSMNWQQIQDASEAVVIVSKVLAEINLPFAIYGFSDFVKVYKEYSQVITPQAFESLLNTYDSTDDTNMFKRVQKDLHQDLQTAVITITDGGSNNADTARQAISEIEGRAKLNRVYGIGIGGIEQHQIDRTYDRGVAIQNIGELTQHLVSLVRGQFRR